MDQEVVDLLRSIADKLDKISGEAKIQKAISVLDAAARLKCSRARVFQLLASGDLDRAQSAGRATLVAGESVDAYLLSPLVSPKSRRQSRRQAPQPASMKALKF